MLLSDLGLELNFLRLLVPPSKILLNLFKLFIKLVQIKQLTNLKIHFLFLVILNKVFFFHLDLGRRIRSPIRVRLIQPLAELVKFTFLALDNNFSNLAFN